MEEKNSTISEEIISYIGSKQKAGEITPPTPEPMPEPEPMPTPEPPMPTPDPIPSGDSSGLINDDKIKIDNWFDIEIPGALLHDPSFNIEVIDKDKIDPGFSIDPKEL
ncbi:MAG: hypothetical protein E7354_03620 [Clostridiales bacterium]|nr:hypothetical protein [Clostridiales bacterium]